MWFCWALLYAAMAFAANALSTDEGPDVPAFVLGTIFLVSCAMCLTSLHFGLAAWFAAVWGRRS